MNKGLFKKSYVLKILEKHEVDIIRHEILNVSCDWQNHYLRATDKKLPLRHGQTIYINAMDIIRHDLILDNKLFFKQTIKLISKIVENSEENLARAYWHKLENGQHIDCHKDIDPIGSDYFKSVNRYQLFLEADSNFVAVMDSVLWNHTESTRLSFKLIHFNFSDFHYYANHSEKPVLFLVMDFFRERQEPIT